MENTILELMRLGENMRLQEWEKLDIWKHIVLLRGTGTQPLGKRVVRKFVGFSLFFTRPLQPMRLAVTVFVLLTVGGIGQAAQAALPGDALYPMKQWSEDVVGRFTLTPGDEARWETERMRRRLEEGEQLTLQSRMSGETKAAFTQGIASQLQRTAEHIDGLMESGNRDEASKIGSVLDQTLRDHAPVLRSMSDSGQTLDTASSSDTTNSTSDSLKQKNRISPSDQDKDPAPAATAISSVAFSDSGSDREQADGTPRAMTIGSSSFSGVTLPIADKDEKFQRIAEESIRVATLSVNDAAALLQSKFSNLSREDASKMQSELAAIQSLLTIAQNNSNRGAFTDARMESEQAMQRAEDMTDQLRKPSQIFLDVRFPFDHSPKMDDGSGSTTE